MENAYYLLSAYRIKVYDVEQQRLITVTFTFNGIKPSCQNDLSGPPGPSLGAIVQICQHLWPYGHQCDPAGASCKFIRYREVAIMEVDGGRRSLLMP